MLIELKFKIEGQFIKRIDSNDIIGDATNTVTAEFEFSEDWVGTKTIIFTYGRKKAFRILKDDNLKCDVPFEVMARNRSFGVSAICGTRNTANVVAVDVIPSGYEKESMPKIPDDSVYETIIQMYDEVKTETKDNDEKISALNKNKADKSSTIAGYGITDAFTKDETQAAISEATKNKADKATTLEEYGIDDAYTKGEINSIIERAIQNKADKGDTLKSYGITDAYTKTETEDLIDQKNVDIDFDSFLTKEDAENFAAKDDVLNLYQTTAQLGASIANKADKKNSLSGYGIEDAYTKNEVDKKISEIEVTGGSVDAYTKSETNALLNEKADKSNTYTKAEVENIHNDIVDDINSKLSSVFTYAGTGDAEIYYFIQNGEWSGVVDIKHGLVFNITGNDGIDTPIIIPAQYSATGVERTLNKGDNVAVINANYRISNTPDWKLDVLAGIENLDAYYTKTEINLKVSDLESEIQEVSDSIPEAVNGKDGKDGKSAYEYAQENGYTGTEAEFAQKIAQEIPTKTSDLTNDTGFIKGSEAPVQSVNSKTGTVKLSATDVGARASTWTPTAEEVGADKKGTASSLVSIHNTNSDSHNDIRLLIDGLNSRLNALANSDDVDLDQMKELVDYIKDNRNLIEQITTNKISYSDIVNNLATNVTNKPLSAAQGVALKGLIDAITIPTKVSELTNDKGYLTGYTETDPTVPSWAKAEKKPSYTKSEIGLGNVDNVKQYSASNPPPYPVKSVNGKTGSVLLTFADVGLGYEEWTFELEDGSNVTKKIAIINNNEPT